MKWRYCNSNFPIICGIYKITSPSRKIYIGQSRDIYNRFSQYDNLVSCNEQRALYNSFLKYGVENHKKEILEECEFDLLNIRERYYQEFYDSVEHGLNCVYTKTDEKPRVVSEETRRKISEINKGRIPSQESIQKRLATIAKNSNNRIKKPIQN